MSRVVGRLSLVLALALLGSTPLFGLDCPSEVLAKIAGSATQSARSVARETRDALNDAVGLVSSNAFDRISKDPVLRYAFTRQLFDLDYMPDAALSKLIASDPELKEAFQTARRVQATVRKSRDALNFVGKLSYQVGATHGAPAISFPYAKTLPGKVGRFVGDFVRLPVLALNPLPTDRTFLSPTEKIYQRLWEKSGHYEPTPKEWQMLEDNHAREHFIERKQFLLTHPKVTLGRRAANLLAKAALSASLGLSANLMAQQMATGGALLTTSQFLDDPKQQLGEDEIQILTETTPFPHLAIRIGDTVYSYGVNHLTSTVVSAYLYESELAKLNGMPQPSSSLKRAFAPPFGRSVQVVTVKVGKEKVAALRRAFESRILDQYRNVTGINDCARMAMRILGWQNRAIDGSPGQLMQWLAERKLGGDPAIRGIVQVSGDGTKYHKTLLLRNTIINSLDSAFFIRQFALTQAQKAIFDLRFDKNLEFRSPELQHYLDQEVQNELEALKEDGYLADLNRKLAALNATREAKRFQAKKEALAFFSGKHLDEEMKKANEVLSAPNSTLEETLRAQARLEYLETWRKDFNGRLRAVDLLAAQNKR